MTCSSSLSLVFLAAFAVACDSKSRQDTISAPPQREGSELSPVTLKAKDFAPKLNADGTRIVFLSGRDAAPAAAVLKAYKSDWPIGDKPGAAARVTSEDLGSEVDVAIDPNAGTWVLLATVKDGTSDLYLKDFAGAAAAVRVPDDATTKQQPSFSPDGALLAWVALDDAGVGTLKIAPVGSGTEADLAQIFRVSGTSEDVRAAFWAPVETGYALVVGAAATSVARLTYSLRTFSAAADAAAATPVEIFADVLPPDGVLGAATKTSVLTARRIFPYDARVVDRIGDIVATDEAPTPQFPLDSEALSAPLGGADATALTSTPGFQVTSLAAGADAGFATMRFFYGCKDAVAQAYGTGVLVAPTDASASTILIPKLLEVTSDGELKFGVAVGFCDRWKTPDTPADGAYRLDDRIVGVAVNRAASATKARVAYVTQFSHRFGAGCVLKVGDPEVMAMDLDGETRQVFGVSSNRAALIDTPQQPPCSL